MKGDFTRFTHDPKKHYTGVLKQQGRVDLDADWNEQVEIQDHLERTANRDVIGLCGVPEEGGGFKIGVYAADLFGVYFVDNKTGWVVGSHSTILFTMDGGKNWTRQRPPVGVTENLHGVYFVDASHGWTVGEGGTILATIDGGSTWTKQIPPPGVTKNLRGVYFVDASHGWTVGEGGTILATIDGGSTWTKQTPPPGVTENLRGVYFEDASHGWTVGEDGTILATANGGSAWNNQTKHVPVEVTKNLLGVYFVDASHYWTVGEGGTILATTNGGSNWNKQTLPVPVEVTKNLLGVYFKDASYGWIVGEGGTILATENGGTDWEKKELADYLAYSFIISGGRIYVDGILVELDQNTTYWNQPDYLAPQPLEGLKLETVENTELFVTVGRTDLIYLEVWQRHITAIEDTDIQEVALGGPDTTTRVKTVWQVKVLPSVSATDCYSDNPKRNEIIAPSGGLLSTGVSPAIAPKEPCKIAPSGGYQGLENRLYRVEIHKGGSLGQATFKWSRDNGSVVFPIVAFDKNNKKILKLKRLAKDQVLTLHVGDWVEVSDDAIELSLEPGTMAEVNKIDEAQMEITLSKDISGYDEKGHPKIRRWDQKSDAKSVSAAGPIELEDGIQIQFSGDKFKAGDYWAFAARTATGNVEELDNEPPGGIKRHYCKLALITWQQGNPPKVTDCRPIFPPLTELTALYYVGGDGQEAMPGEELPGSLKVRVANGQIAVEGALVQFEIVKPSPSDGNGNLKNVKQSKSGKSIKVETDEFGIADCEWSLDSKPGIWSQQVRASLLDIALRDEKGGLLKKGTEPEHPSIFFNANASVADKVYYKPPAECTKLPNVKTVKAALDELCKLCKEPVSETWPQVRGISWINDQAKSLDNFMTNGLTVIFTKKIDPKTINLDTFIVTLELPHTEILNKEPICSGHQILIVYGDIVYVNIPYVEQWTQWTFIPKRIDQRIFNIYPNDELYFKYLNGQQKQIRCRVVLKGNMILDVDGYRLDGDVFGQVITDGSITYTGLKFPSGDGKEGGDFESWFYLVSPPS